MRSGRGRFVSLVLALAALLGSSGFTFGQPTVPAPVIVEPPLIVLRTASGAVQLGESGSFCWVTICSDYAGFPTPRRPVGLEDGEAFELDFRALGKPDDVWYSVFRYADYYPTDRVGNPISSSSVPLPLRRGPLPPAEEIPFSLDLPPSRYLFGLFATYPDRDTSQGFHLILEEAPTAAGTPLPSNGGPGAADCQGVSRSLASVEAAVARGTSTPETETNVATEDDLPDGAPADLATFGAVTAFEHEFAACYNAADWPRLLALVTDEIVPSFFEGDQSAAAALSATSGTPDTDARGVIHTIVVAVRDVRVLPDGRIGAVVEWARSDRNVVDERNFRIDEYEQGDGRWLLDGEISGFQSDEFGVEGTPPPGGVYIPPEAEATASPAAFAPTECRVAPRAIPLYEALALLPASTPESDERQPNSTASVPTGAPADAETVAAVTATMREYVACRNAGDYRRQFALVTDNYLRGFFATVAEIAIGLRMPPALAVLTFTAGSPRPRAEQVWITIEAIDDVRVLPDGRVSAVVVSRDPTRDPEIATSVAHFEQVEGRWLLDGGLDPLTAAITGALEP